MKQTGCSHRPQRRQIRRRKCTCFRMPAINTIQQTGNELQCHKPTLLNHPLGWDFVVLLGGLHFGGLVAADAALRPNVIGHEGNNVQTRGINEAELLDLPRRGPCREDLGPFMPTRYPTARLEGNCGRRYRQAALTYRSGHEQPNARARTGQDDAGRRPGDLPRRGGRTPPDQDVYESVGHVEVFPVDCVGTPSSEDLDFYPDTTTPAQVTTGLHTLSIAKSPISRANRLSSNASTDDGAATGREFAITELVDWNNHRLFHSNLRHVPPIEQKSSTPVSRSRNRIELQLKNAPPNQGPDTLSGPWNRALLFSDP